MGVFDGQSLVSALNLRISKAVHEVNVEEPEIMRFSAEAVIERVVEQYDYPSFEIGDTVTSKAGVTEAQLNMAIGRDGTTWTSGNRIELLIPYSGPVELISMKPSQSFFSSQQLDRVHPEGDQLCMVLEGQNLSAQIVREEISATIDRLRQTAVFANTDLERFRHVLRRDVTGTAMQRKAVLDSAKALEDALAIPVHKVSSPSQVPIPVKRRALRAIENTSLTEPALAAEIYADVLRTITAMTDAMSRTPTASKLKEEELRNIILFVLNANYEGAALGEVFNNSGHTDILMPWNGRNAFVAECKMWGGPKTLTDALDQLRDLYLVWNDTHAAIVMFVRDTKVETVVNKAHDCVEKHAAWVSSAAPGDSELRRDYLIRARKDGDRLINLAVLLVVLPTNDPRNS